MAKRILTIDGNNYANRAYYATLSRQHKYKAKDGSSSAAIHGFLQILLADAKYLDPRIILVTFDKGGSSHRGAISEDYKSNRNHDHYDVLVPQMRATRELMKILGIKTVQRRGVEADDLIGDVARKMPASWEILISTTDKDLAQHVKNGRAYIVEASTRTLLDEQAVLDKYGVWPHQIAEWLALCGDGVDNIAGVPGCGRKTASKLLTTHGSIRGIYKNINKITPALKRNLLESREQLKKSLSLSSAIDTGLRVEVERFRQRETDRVELRKFLKYYGLQGLSPAIDTYLVK